MKLGKTKELRNTFSITKVWLHEFMYTSAMMIILGTISWLVSEYLSVSLVIDFNSFLFLLHYLCFFQQDGTSQFFLKNDEIPIIHLKMRIHKMIGEQMDSYRISWSESSGALALYVSYWIQFLFHLSFWRASRSIIWSGLPSRRGESLSQI